MKSKDINQFDANSQTRTVNNHRLYICQFGKRGALTVWIAWRGNKVYTFAYIQQYGKWVLVLWNSNRHVSLNCPHLLVSLWSKYSLYYHHMECSCFEVETMFIAWRWERGANGKGTCAIARSPQRGNSPVHNFGGISILNTWMFTFDGHFFAIIIIGGDHN